MKPFAFPRKEEIIGSRALRPSRYADRFRVMEAMFWKEVRAIHGPSGFGFLLALLEPVVHIALIAFWHWILRIKPVYGNSKVLFLATGLYPVFIFIHVASHARRSGKHAERGLPPESPVDVIFVSAAVNFLLYMYIGVLLFFLMSILITPQSIPWNLEPCLSSACALGLLGLATGFVNAGIEPVFPAWHLIFGPLIRMMALFSGVLFVADNTLPANIRYWLSFNPVMHALERFRMGFYPMYPRLVYDAAYLWEWVLGMLIFGFIVMHASKRHED